MQSGILNSDAFRFSASSRFMYDPFLCSFTRNYGQQWVEPNEHLASLNEVIQGFIPPEGFLFAGFIDTNIYIRP